MKALAEGDRQSANFFSRLTTATPTRVWINNPTLREVDLALAQGAVGCTTNPAFAGSLLRREPSEVLPVIRATIDASSTDATDAETVQLRLVSRIVDRFRGLYQATEGRQGFVSVQGAPEVDDDPGAILVEAEHARALGPNATPKIPATAAGLSAFEALVADSSPTIVTEVFSLAQLIETCERYLAAAPTKVAPPPFFVSPITGIFGDHLKTVAAANNLSVDASELELVGVALARSCLDIVAKRKYPVTLLCGGARTPFDLLGIVGSDAHATINWSTFAEILESEPSLEPGIREPIDPDLVDRLRDTFVDVRRALDPDGLGVEEFAGFGPVQYFRANFATGWETLRTAITTESSPAAT